MGRRDVYRRTEGILMHDKVSASGISAIERDITAILSRYMQVSDMHIKFRRLKSGGYKIYIEGIARNISVPIAL